MFVARARTAQQYLKGVFLAVPIAVNNPILRDRPITDDVPFPSLGDAILEVRTFDTTYIEVYAPAPGLLDPLVRRFGGSVEKQP
jgi:hypothetical protein